MEGDGAPSGWPLGLGNVTIRITVADNAQPQAPPPQRPLAARVHRSSSFSSFSSSNLDTESTASFFPDESVSLGRLIGIKPANQRTFYNEQRRKIGSDHDEPIPSTEENPQGLCAPLLYHVIGKITRSGSTSKSLQKTLTSSANLT